MSQKKKPTANATAASENTSGKSQQKSNTRRIQNCLLIWLDASIDEVKNKDSIKTLSKLREVVDNICTFTNVDECINFISEIHDDKTFVISSGAFGQTVVPIVHDKPQVSAIYIFCGNKSRHEQWAQQWPKVKGVFTEIKPICEALKTAVQEDNQDTISLSSTTQSSGITIKNPDQLDLSFMYTQVLKEILLTIDFAPQHFQEFISFCRTQFVDNPYEFEKIKEFEHEYHQHTPIWWYTCECFLYHIVNGALRTMEVNVIIKSGFFICDLHRHIAKLHSEQYGGHHHSQTFTVYQGQGMSRTDFDRLLKTNGGLLSFNNFLSTQQERRVSLGYARDSLSNSNVVGILFVMTVDPSISSVPFADVRKDSFFPHEKEILFSMHSIFRIGGIRQIDGNNRLWEVNMSLTHDNDSELNGLTECVRKETFLNESPWYRLGELLIKMGAFDVAEQVYTELLYRASDNREKSNLFHQLQRIKEHQGEYAHAITYSEKALEIQQKTLSYKHPDLAVSHNNIGSLYKKMGAYSKALSFHEKALEIQKQSLPPNHPDLAITYNNIGSLYEKMGEYSKALSLDEQALEIQLQSLPENHPDLAITYNNIGSVYEKMGDYSKALSSHGNALDTQKGSLPPNHPNLAISYNNIGSVFEKMGEYSEALLCDEKALEIQQKSLPPNHPDFTISYSNIGCVYEKIGECSKALLLHEKALEIQQRNLPPNHPNFAITYNNIGSVYEKMGEYMNALSFQGKAFKIFQLALPPNHPDLATSYNIMGKALNVMGEYPKALSAHEKALEIQKQSLPANHPDSATSYHNIGRVYTSMGNCSKALSSYERALDIGQRSLPENHPNLQTYKKDIESLKKKM